MALTLGSGTDLIMASAEASSEPTERGHGHPEVQAASSRTSLRSLLGAHVFVVPIVLDSA